VIAALGFAAIVIVLIRLRLKGSKRSAIPYEPVFALDRWIGYAAVMTALLYLILILSLNQVMEPVFRLVFIVGLFGCPLYFIYVALRSVLVVLRGRQRLPS
jgi:hypothetical protein